MAWCGGIACRVQQNACRCAANRIGSEKTHLTIGVAVPAATYLPLYVAVDEGTFAKQGLRADLVEFRGGSDLIRAIVSKSVDVGVVSRAEITSGLDAGWPVQGFHGRFH